MHSRIVHGALLVATLAFVAQAGDLNPPPGPIGPTMKPLDQVEPRIVINAVNTPGDADSVFKITQPGSYYLAGNLNGEAGKHGIEIEASYVTIDLRGHVLLGVPGSLRGIYLHGAYSDIAVANGAARGWGVAGIDIGEVLAYGTSRVTHVSATENGNTGIRAGSGSVVFGCTATRNAIGIIASTGSVVQNCSAILNSQTGIFGSEGCTITACSAQSNGFAGIYIPGPAHIVSCNSSYNTGIGIYGGWRSTISGCTANSNYGDGIKVETGCHVENNLVQGNGPGGHDAAGIHAVQGRNRIEGNNVIENDRGIDVDAAGNFIVRNSASGNTTHYAITGTQTIGQIITATGTISTSNPWVNFAY